MNQFLQIIFYHYVLNASEILPLWRPDFFDAKSLQICFKNAQEYAMKYHQAPSCSQLKEILHINGEYEIVDDDLVDTIYSSERQVREYTPDWLYDNATSWATWKNLLLSIRSTSEYIKLNQDTVSVENVKEITEHAKSLFDRNCVLDFSGASNGGSDFWDAKNHKQEKMKRFSTGFKFLDTCMNGGYFEGCLIVFAGAPKIGKSLWLQNLCAESIKKGNNSAYVSLELSEEMINNRIGSNMFSINSLSYHFMADDEVKMKEIITNYRKSCVVSPGALIVKQFPTSSCSVIELENYLLQEEDRRSIENHPFKFKTIFVDYINIMKNYRNPNSENTYMKIKQIAEDLRAIAIKHGWTIISATQTKAGQFDTSDVNVGQISESSGLNATVDLMFGIIADAQMRRESRYVLKCLYDRVAPFQDLKKDYTLVQEFMRLTETSDEAYYDITLPAHAVAQRMTNSSTNATPNSNVSRQMPPNASFSSGSLETPITETPETPMFNPVINITGNGLFG